MALQKQLVHLNLTGGVDTKTDPRLVLPTRLAAATNVLFDDANTLIKRGGFGVDLSGGAMAVIGSVDRATKYKSDYIIESVANGVFRKAPDAGVIAIPGDMSEFTIPDFTRGDLQTSAVGAGTADTVPYAFDVATLGEYTAWVWEVTNAATGNRAISVVTTNTTTGEVLSSATLESATAEYLSPRIVAGSSKFFIYYIYISGASSVRMTPFENAMLGIEQVINASAHGDFIFDASPPTAADTSISVALKHTSGDIFMYRLDADDGYTINASGNSTPSIGVESLAVIGVDDAGTKRTVAVYSQSNNQVYAMAIVQGGGTIVEQALITSPAGGARVGRIALYDSQTPGTATFEVLVDVNLAGAYTSPPVPGDQLIFNIRAPKNLTGAKLDRTTFLGVFIQGRPSLVRGRVLLPVIRMYDLDPTVFVVDITNYLSAANRPPTVVARVSYGECGGLRSKWAQKHRVPATVITSASATTLVFGYTRWTADLQLTGTTNVTPIVVARGDLDMVARGLSSLEAQDGLLLAGGCPHWYDGRGIVEAGFNWRPRIKSVTLTGGAPLVTGTYFFAATYAWQDSRGNWHESAPSELVSAAPSGAIGANVIVESLGLTWKPKTKVILYRTIANGTVLYRDAQVNNLTASTGVTVAATQTDAAIISGDMLPTTGGVLPNEPPPPHRQASVFQDRVFFAGADDGNVIYFSQKLDRGFGIECSIQLTRPVPQQFGRVVAVHEMDSKLVAVCEKKIGILYGEGPTRAGAQDGYSAITAIVHETGGAWDSPRAVIGSPDGLWFRSLTGLHLLGRDGGITRNDLGYELGAEVASTVTAGTAVVALAPPGSRRIHFFVSGSNKIVVWDYQFRQWTTLQCATYAESPTGVGDIIDILATGSDWHVVTTANVWKYSVAMGTDGAVQFLAVAETAWLQFAGIQGFQRIYRLMMVGEASANQIMSLQVGYDFGTLGTVVNGVTVAPSGTVVQVQHHFARQKCEALKLKVFWAQSTGTTRMRLTDLTLQVGVKPGYYKVPSAQRI